MFLLRKLWKYLFWKKLQKQSKVIVISGIISIKGLVFIFKSQGKAIFYFYADIYSNTNYNNLYCNII